MYKTSHLIIIFIIGIFFGACFAFASIAQAATYSDTFDSYSSGTNLSGLGSWVTINQTTATVSNSQSETTPNSVVASADFNVDRLGIALATTTSFSMEADVMLTSIPGGSNNVFNNGIEIYPTGGGSSGRHGITVGRINGSASGVRVTVSDVAVYTATTTINNWHSIRLDGNTGGYLQAWVDGVSVFSTSTAPYSAVWQYASLSTNTPGNSIFFLDNYSLATNGDEPPTPVLNTSIVNYSPTNGSITASTSVNFDVDIISGYPVGSEVCLFLVDLSVGQNIVPECDDIIASGYLNFDFTKNLTSEHWYQGTWAIRDSDGVNIDTKLFTFHVVNNPYVTWVPPPSNFPSTTDSNPTDQNLPDWLSNILNIDNALVDKHPWAWAIDFAQVLYEVTNSPPSNVSAPLLILDLAIGNSSSTNMFHVDVDTDSLEDVTVFSSSTVGELIPVDTIRELIRFALWLIFMWYIWATVRRMFN